MERIPFPVVSGEYVTVYRPRGDLYRGGDKMQLICRVGLEEITAVTELSKQNRRAPANIKRYNYAQDLWPARALVLSVSNADGECEVLICPDQRIEELLNKHNVQQ